MSGILENRSSRINPIRSGLCGVGGKRGRDERSRASANDGKPVVGTAT